MEEKTDTLAQRLKLARKKRGLTQVDLAKLAKVKQSDVSKLERGKALATAAIARLARGLRVPTIWLEENDGEIPDWDASLLPPPPSTLTLSEDELLNRLRPEWRDLILAYEELLPSDRETLVQPMLDKASDARRYVEAAMARQGVQYRPLRTTGNLLPMAPRHEDSERRQVILGRNPERRKPQPIQDTSAPGMPPQGKKDSK